METVNCHTRGGFEQDFREDAQRMWRPMSASVGFKVTPFHFCKKLVGRPQMIIDNVYVQRVMCMIVHTA